MKQLIPWFLLLCTACSRESDLPDAAVTDPALPQAETAAVLSWDGYGSLRFGMNVEAAERVVGTINNPERALDSGCDYISFASMPDIRFMVEGGVITRGEAAQGITNALGIAVGDSLASVTSAHPEAVVTPHKYDPAGHYLVFKSADGSRAIVLETRDEKVSLIRAGLEPAVEYVESCG